LPLHSNFPFLSRVIGRTIRPPYSLSGFLKRCSACEIVFSVPDCALAATYFDLHGVSTKNETKDDTRTG